MKKPTPKLSSKKEKYCGTKRGRVSDSEAAATTEVYMAERIDGKRKRAGKIQYLVKWKDWPASSNTWEPLEHLTECDELIEDYELTAAKKRAKTKHGRCEKAKETEPSSSSATDICKSPDQSGQLSGSQSGPPQAEPDHLPAKDCGLANNKWIPEEILGATDIQGELKFLIKFKGLNREYLVPSRTLRRLDPKMLIRYYEQHTKWMED